MSVIVRILLLVLFVLCDILSKISVMSYLKTMPGYSKPVTWFFNLVYTWNYGMSFGLFHQYHKYSNMAFIALNSSIALYICYLLFTVKSRLETLGYSLIAGGAIGNLYDRILNGAVFDFLHFHFYDYHFPVFNIADSFISLGVALLILQHFFMREDASKQK
ncbi:MAG: signal peptidase II [Pseudomonadota bacterium]